MRIHIYIYVYTYFSICILVARGSKTHVTIEKKILLVDKTRANTSQEGHNLENDGGSGFIVTGKRCGVPFART